MEGIVGPVGEVSVERLQMLKAFYELRLMQKPVINSEFDRRCAVLLDSTQEWFQSRPTQTSLLAKYTAVMVSFVASPFFSPRVVSFARWIQPLGAVPAVSETSRTLNTVLRVTFELGCLFGIGVVFYQVALKLTKPVAVWLERHSKWKWLKKVEL